MLRTDTRSPRRIYIHGHKLVEKKQPRYLRRPARNSSRILSRALVLSLNFLTTVSGVPGFPPPAPHAQRAPRTARHFFCVAFYSLFSRHLCSGPRAVMWATSMSSSFSRARSRLAPLNTVRTLPTARLQKGQYEVESVLRILPRSSRTGFTLNLPAMIPPSLFSGTASARQTATS
jgi:hypothetical protein